MTPTLASRPSRAQSEALTYCQEVTRGHSQTFYLGTRFFGAQQRRAVWAVYATCRAGDDIVDDAQGNKVERLAQWWNGVEAAFEGRPLPTRVSLALAWAVQRYPIPLEPFHELRAGLYMDLDGQQYHSMDELNVYCRRVAGVVGFMIAPISGYRGGEQTLRQALLLGQAMQLTNILRDVGEDLKRGRVYLPTDQLQAFGVTRAHLEEGKVTPQYRALMRQLMSQARDWYRESQPGISLLQGRSRFAVAAAAAAYEAILDDLEQADYNNFTRRAYVSGPRKLLLLPRAFARAALPTIP